MAVDKREAPLEVSVPVRYSQDDRTWEDGVVRTVGGGGFVIQASVIPDTGAKLFFALGLGGETAFHGEGRVTTLPAGDGSFRGFGLRFDGTPNELAALTAKLGQAYPGPLSLDGEGRIAWPITVAGELPLAGPDEPSVTLRTAGHEAGRTSADPAASATSTTTPLPVYVGLLQHLTRELASLRDDDVRLSYRGRPLAPGSGVPARVIGTGLTALGSIRPQAPGASAPGSSGGASELWTLDLGDLDAPLATVPITPLDDDAPSDAEILWDHPILELIAAQMRVMDTLAAADWRFQRLGPEAREALDRDHTLLDGIQLRLATSAEEAGLGEVAVQEVADGVEAIGAFVERAAWHATSIEPIDTTVSALETFHIEKERLARQAVMSARAAAREAEEQAARKTDTPKADATKKRGGNDKPRKPATKPSKVGGVSVLPADLPEQVQVPKWAVGAAAGGVLLALFSLQRTLAGREVEVPKTIDVPAVRAAAQQASPAFPLQDLVVDQGTLKVVVGADWLGRPVGDRAGDFEKVTTVLVSRGFWDVVVQTPDGKEQASMHKGVFNVVGFERKER